MDRAIITWDQDVVRLRDVKRSRHPALRSHGYYAVLAATLDEPADVWHSLELLYIGEAFDHRMRDALPTSGRVNDRLAAHVAGKEGQELLVMLGEQTGATLKRVTRAFTNDVLRCLVTRHSPPCNDPIVGPHAGRKISVINRGDFRPLKLKCLLRPGS